ncbi:hypothetical protein MRX96_022255 [Rhipicephalus microplus]
MPGSNQCVQDKDDCILKSPDSDFPSEGCAKCRMSRWRKPLSSPRQQVPLHRWEVLHAWFKPMRSRQGRLYT